MFSSESFLSNHNNVPDIQFRTPDLLIISPFRPLGLFGTDFPCFIIWPFQSMLQHLHIFLSSHPCDIWSKNSKFYIYGQQRLSSIHQEIRTKSCSIIPCTVIAWVKVLTCCGQFIFNYSGNMPIIEIKVLLNLSHDPFPSGL